MCHVVVVLFAENKTVLQFISVTFPSQDVIPIVFRGSVLLTVNNSILWKSSA